MHDVCSYSPLLIGSEDNSVPSSEQEMVRKLTDSSFNVRDDALASLKESIQQCDGSHVPFSDPLSVFQGLSVALEDDEWDRRYQCVKVVNDLVPLLDTRNLERCMHEILPQMVCRLGDAKITVSRAAAHALGTYAECTSDIQILYDAIIRCGLKANDGSLRLSIIDSIPSLLEASHGHHQNLEQLLASVIELTFDTHFLRPVELCLRKISSCVGATEFDACIQHLPMQTQELYCELQNDGTDNNSSTPESPDMLNGTSDDHNSPEVSTKAARVHVSHKDLKKSHTSPEKADVLYGFIPSNIVSSLNNCDDNWSLSRAVEDLRAVVSDSEKVVELQSHMSEFLDFLSSLLDDGVSFQVL